MPSRLRKVPEGQRPVATSLHAQTDLKVALTRRQWTSALAALAVLPVDAQTRDSQAVTPVSSDKLAKASKEVRDASERLAQMEVAMNVEPAFLFRP